MLGSGQIRLRLFRSENPETQKIQFRFSKKIGRVLILSLITYFSSLQKNEQNNISKENK